MYLTQKGFEIYANSLADLRMLMDNERVGFSECMFDLRKKLTEICLMFSNQHHDSTKLRLINTTFTCDIHDNVPL